MTSVMADIRKQIGLDFLRTREISQIPPGDRAREKASAGLSGALIAYGREVLSAVRQAEPEPARLYAVVDQLHIPIDVVLEVVDYLEKQGYVTVLDRDLKGNHALRLTAAGAALLR
jgi:hypothetical protein